MTVWVDRGTVEYLYYEDNGRPVPQSVANSFPSAEQLFDAVQDGINRRADRINVDYDPTYGYPTNVFIDYDRTTGGGGASAQHVRADSLELSRTLGSRSERSEESGSSRKETGSLYRDASDSSLHSE